MKRLYEHYHKTADDQNILISNLKEDNHNLKTENDQLTLEVLKQVKEKAKMAKEHEIKLKEMEKEVEKGYDKANELFQENLVLIEEKRVQDELEKISEEFKRKEEEDLLLEEELNLVTTESDIVEEVTEEQTAAFMRKQPRSTSNSPMFEPQNNSSVTCNVCNFKANNVTQLKGHLSGHPQCEVCKMRFKTVGLLNRHEKKGTQHFLLQRKYDIRIRFDQFHCHQSE